MTGEDTPSTFSEENARLVSRVRAEKSLLDAKKKYFVFSDEKKKNVVELINLLSE